MRKCLSITGVILLAFFIALSGFLIPPLFPSHNSSTYSNSITLPVLTATITSPASGATITIGRCFEVTATITVTCPLVSSVENSVNGLSPENTVFARSCDLQDVEATIAISGNARAQGATTKTVAANMNCPDWPTSECPSEATVSWTVCCTGAGAVQITVTPSGDYTSQFVWHKSAVFANGTWYPLPAENLISDSISVIQTVDFYQKLIEDSVSPSWSRPSNVKTTNTWTNTHTAQAGQQVVVYANIANRGDAESPYTATMKINGVVEEVKIGMLQGNTAVPLKFLVSRNEPGIYTVDINGQQTYFTVVGDATSSGTAFSGKDISRLAALVILSICIVVLVILIIRRRQQHAG